MKLTRKIFAFVLIVSIICSLAICGQAATFSDVSETHPRYEAINELSGLGIINGYTDGTFQPDKAVTRAEMAKLIAVLFSIDEATSGAIPFSDITSDYWALNYIIAVKNLAIIEGYPDGTFLPDKEVTYQEAITMIIRAYGYEEAAKQEAEKKGTNIKEDWSAPYRDMAATLGISKNAIMTISDSAPRGVIAQLLFNGLDVATAVTVIDSKTGKVTYKQGDEPLRDRFSYKSFKNAYIVCNPTINLDENNKLIKDGAIRVKTSDGTNYDMLVGENTSFYDYIGQYVNVSYEVVNNEYVVKAITPLSKVTEISLDKVKNFTPGNIEYYTTDDYNATTNIRFDTVDVVYNERTLNAAAKANYATILNSAITLGSGELSYFGDVKVSVYNNHAYIVVKGYKSYLAKTAIGSDKLLKLDSARDILMDTSVYDIARKTSLTGTASETISVSVPSVVSISESEASGNIIGKPYLEYIVTKETKGTPTETTTDSKGPYKGVVKIGSESIKVTSATEAEKFEVGMEATFYKDAKGNIVRVTSVSDGDKRFGFYSKFESETNGTYRFKFFNAETGSSFTASTDDSNIVDQIENLVSDYGRLVWIELSGSKIKRLEYAEDVDNGDDKTLSGSVTYAKGGNVKVDGSSYTFSGSTGTSTKMAKTGSVTYIAPTSGSSEIKYEKLTMVTGSGAEHNNVFSYEIKRTEGDSKTVIVAKPFDGLHSKYNAYVVKNTGSSVSVGNDITATNMECYNFQTGAESKITILPSVISQAGLEEGDVFVYVENSTTSGVTIDKAESVYVLFDLSYASQKQFDNIEENLGGSNYKTAYNAANYKNGFRSYKIWEADMTHNYYNYSLSLPLWYNSKVLYLARTGVTSAGGDIDTYLPGDSELGTELKDITEWNGNAIIGKLEYGVRTDAEVTASTKVFVYDSSEDAKLQLITGNLETLDTEIGKIITMANQNPASESEIMDAADECPLIFSYFEGYSDTLRTLYIIK